MIRLSVKPWTQQEIVFELGSGYVVARGLKGAWLGSWPSDKVGAEPGSGGRVTLTIAREAFLFETRDPDGFIWDVESEKLRLRDTPVTQRLSLAIRTRWLHMTTATSLPTVKKGRTWSLRKRPHGTVASGQSLPASQREASDGDGASEIDLLHKRVLVAQDSVVDALGLALRSWFGFYFRVAEGDTEQRYQSAAKGLLDASSALAAVSEDLTSSDYLGSPWAESVSVYRASIARWAEGVNLIGRGIELDEQHLADSGFYELDEATRSLRDAVHHVGVSELSKAVAEPLAYLSSLKAPPRASRRRVKEAKQPWWDAVVAAAQPLRRRSEGE